MKYSRRIPLVVALLGAVVLGAGGSAVAAGQVLDNLAWTSTRTMSGAKLWLLRLEKSPDVAPGGVYFLWDPETSTLAGRFMTFGDDVPGSRTVQNWKSVRFVPNTAVDRVEVRYGDVDAPEEAVVVAGANW